MFLTREGNVFSLHALLIRWLMTCAVHVGKTVSQEHEEARGTKRCRGGHDDEADSRKQQVILSIDHRCRPLFFFFKERVESCHAESVL